MPRKKSLFKVTRPRAKIGGMNISSKGISHSVKTPLGTYNTRQGLSRKGKGCPFAALMISVPVVLFLLLALSSCGGGAETQSSPPADLVQTAVAGTIAAQPAATEAPTLEPSSTLPPPPTNTPEPTATPKPTNTPSQPSKSVEDVQKDIIGLITKYLESGELLIEKVAVVRFGDPGVFEIEVNNAMMARDNQPDLSYDMIAALAKMFIDGGLTRDKAITLGGGDDFVIRITTYSADGNYRYQSDTNYETLEKIYNKQISYEEWVAAANADFR